MSAVPQRFSAQRPDAGSYAPSSETRRGRDRQPPLGRDLPFEAFTRRLVEGQSPIQQLCTPTAHLFRAAAPFIALLRGTCPSSR